MPPQLVYLTPPLVLLAPATMKPSWEYGLVSSPFWWVTRPFLLLIFHEQGMCPEPTLDRLEIVYREAGHKDLPVLNPMGAMLRRPGVWRNDPRWGRVLAFSGGWLYSPWFGYLNVRSFPAVEHHLMKELLYVGSQPDDLWFFKGGLGIFLTSEVSFPSLYVNDHKEWGYLLDTDFAHAAVRLPGGEELLLSLRTNKVPVSLEADGAFDLAGGSGIAYNAGIGPTFSLASANTTIDYPDGMGPLDGPGIPSMDGWSQPGGTSQNPSGGSTTTGTGGSAIANGGLETTGSVALPTVPEPSGWGLLIGALAVLAGVKIGRPGTRRYFDRLWCASTAKRQIRSHNSPNPTPIAPADCGSRLVAVIPGRVLTSKHQNRPASSRRKSDRL